MDSCSFVWIVFFGYSGLYRLLGLGLKYKKGFTFTHLKK
ncbi:MAG: DUF4260 family protein [Bacteroidetes bacterium]|nr:DUF4260 family protein [Bacteroidota bacterium]MBS1757517.1 DUF4260 family protein [Bacteroidota bacterium]